MPIWKHNNTNYQSEMSTQHNVISLLGNNTNNRVVESSESCTHNQKHIRANFFSLNAVYTILRSVYFLSEHIS